MLLKFRVSIGLMSFLLQFSAKILVKIFRQQFSVDDLHLTIFSGQFVSAKFALQISFARTVNRPKRISENKFRSRFAFV